VGVALGVGVDVGDAERVALALRVGAGDADGVALALGVGVGDRLDGDVDGDAEGDADVLEGNGEADVDGDREADADGLGDLEAPGPELAPDEVGEREGDEELGGRARHCVPEVAVRAASVTTFPSAGSCMLTDSPETRKPTATRSATARTGAKDIGIALPPPLVRVAACCS
jgi:hypothetical protein